MVLVEVEGNSVGQNVLLQAVPLTGVSVPQKVLWFWFCGFGFVVFGWLLVNLVVFGISGWAGANHQNDHQNS
jgi:hypothetical protein